MLRTTPKDFSINKNNRGVARVSQGRQMTTVKLRRKKSE